MPAIERSVPPMSSSMRSFLSCDGRRRVIAKITSTTRNSPKNPQRQLAYVVSVPPIIGPTAIPTAVTPPTVPKAFARSLPS
jgi:hypothetical protein